MSVFLPVLSLLCALSVQAAPVVEQPAPVEQLDLGGTGRAWLIIESTLDRWRAALLSRALDRLIYIDMAPTPGAGGPGPGVPGPGVPGDKGAAGPNGGQIGPRGGARGGAQIGPRGGTQGGAPGSPRPPGGRP